MMHDGLTAPTTLKEVLARDATRRVARQTIRALQTLRGEHLQSGPDSGLRDVWDEICVQVQSEESPLLEVYEDVVRAMILRLLEPTPRTQLHAIWLRANPYEDEREDPENRASTANLAYCLDDVVEYVRAQVLSAAADWSNPRLRKWLSRRS